MLKNHDMIVPLSHKMAVAGRDVPSLLAYWKGRCPDKPFLIWSPFEGDFRTWTYAEFYNDALKIAAGLQQRGIGKGNRVMIHLDNCPEFILAWYACAVLGAVAVTTNTTSAVVQEDLAYYFRKTECVALITESVYWPLTGLVREACKLIAITDSQQADPYLLTQLSSGHTERFEALFSPMPLEPQGLHDPMTDFSIQFTSGTTSKPKAVVWTHGNAIWGAQTNARNFGLQHSDICQAFLPLFHTNNQSYSLMGTLWVGGTYLLQPKFSKTHFWSAATRHRATWSAMIPFCVKALSSLPVPEHNFRFWTPAVSLPSFEAQFGLKIVGLYGMTETITTPIVGDTNHPGPEMCIGRPCSGYDISVRGEGGSEVSSGEVGDLYIRGYPGTSLFKEYFGDSEATAESFDRDGWFITGDRVSYDDGGNMFFADRSKDMLKVGGENVAASEIEALIMNTSWVEEVAVVGQKHFMLDEVPVAFVTASTTAPADLEQEITRLCEQKLAKFKRVWTVHIIDEFPRSLLNKISKKELRDGLAELTE